MRPPGRWLAQAHPGDRPPSEARPARVAAPRAIGPRDSPFRIHWTECAGAPDPRGPVSLFERNLGKLVIDAARKLGLEPVADFDARRWAVRRFHHSDRIGRPDNDPIAAVEPEGDASITARAFGLHLRGAERRRFDVD